jgi:hypothetical protein
LIVLASFLHVLVHVPAKGIALMEKTAHFPAVMGAGAVVSLGLDFLLIPSLGMMGAAWSMLAGQVTCMVLMLRLSQRLYHIPYEWPRLGKLLAVAVACAGAGWFVADWPMLDRLVVKTMVLLFFPIGVLSVGFLTREEVAVAVRQLMRIARQLRDGATSGGRVLPAAVASRSLVVTRATPTGSHGDTGDVTSFRRSSVRVSTALARVAARCDAWRARP